MKYEDCNGIFFSGQMKFDRFSNFSRNAQRNLEIESVNRKSCSPRSIFRWENYFQENKVDIWLSKCGLVACLHPL